MGMIPWRQMQRCLLWSLNLCRQSGIKEFQLSVGHLGFFQSLIEDAALDEEARERVIELINNRNYFGVEEYLDSIMVKRSSKEAFAALGNLVGGVEVLQKQRTLHPIPVESWL